MDDYRAVAEGLRRLLQMDKDIDVVGVATSGEEALSKAALLAPDVVTMDLRMEGMNGIDTTRRLKQMMPQVRVLALTMYGEDHFSQAITAGVSGYLLKDCDHREIVRAVHQVYAGACPITPSLQPLYQRDRALAPG